MFGQTREREKEVSCQRGLFHISSVANYITQLTNMLTLGSVFES